MNKKYLRYYQSVQYLESLNNLSGSYQKTNLTSHTNPDMYLERMQYLLDQVGNPERDFKYIHITGTSGKGSVSSTVHETLLKNGHRSGLFTSPFVVSTIEKIQVDNKYIDPNIFSDIVEYLKPYIDRATIHGRYGTPSYFEIIFAIALIYFKKEKCDYVVLEVGLGGRYDATNIIKKPIVTAITNISLDHEKILGDTVEKIALDKAGIIKKDSIFLTTENNAKLLSIFKKICKETGAKYNECTTENTNYKEKNMILAGTICVALNIIKDTKDISIPNTFPARFEIIEINPLVIIDGAHNESKMISTLYNIRNLKKLNMYKKIHAIIAISSDKNWKSIIKIILPEIDTFYITRFSNPNRQCINPKEVVEFIKINNKKVVFYSDPTQAFSEARKTIKKKDALLVTGSFFLAGDIRKIYCPEDTILKQRNSSIN